VVAGGPGAGKTTLLLALQARGYTIVPDSARIIIKERKSGGLSPRPEPPEFAYDVLRMDIDHYRALPAEDKFVFFERGIPDALGLLAHLGLLTSADTGRYLSEFPYSRSVLVLPPWEEIYTTDDERDQTFSESVRVHAAVCDWYARCGYDLIEVPRMPVDERCEFVLRTLARDDE
jgi:predicted ATPase